MTRAGMAALGGDKQQDATPSVIRYFAASIACDKDGRQEQALHLFEERAARREPSVISYHAAISSCEKDARPEHPLQPLEEMKQHGVKPDFIAYSAAISACEKGGTTRAGMAALRGENSTEYSLMSSRRMLQTVLVRRVHAQSRHCGSWRRRSSTA
jgi:hypothetical protein